MFSQNKIINKLDSLVKIDKFEDFENTLSLHTKDTTKLKKEEKARLYLILANYYYKQDKTELALFYFKKAEMFYNKTLNFSKVADIDFNIFILLKSQDNLTQNNEAKKYLDKYYKFAIKTNNKKNLINSYFGYARILLEKKKYKKALEFYNKTINLSIKIKDSSSLAKGYSNKGITTKRLYKKSDSARFYYRKALKIYLIKNQNQKIFSTIINISSSYKSEKNYKEAIKWLKKADSIPITSFKINSKKFLYKLMSKNYEKLADYKNANFYLKKHLAYKDSVDIKEQNIAISDIQTKYETAKKEKDIIKLKAEKDQQTNYMIIGGGSFIFILLLGVLANYNLKRKKDLAERNRQLEHQKVVTLMKEQELKTLDAILEGQEKERKRIAEDLHDNLGSKLAVLKLQFDSFVDSEITKNNNKLKNRLISTSGLLEDTYQTVRSMSHVESKSEVQQSLVHSVKALAANISNSNKLAIEVIDFGLEESINHKIEIFSLRIIQELLTNTIKYANAKKATIDLTLFDNVLGIIVSDDGIGFDIKNRNKKGIGLKSIEERILKLNGSINIDSGLGNGTTIIIELPIKQNNI